MMLLGLCDEAGVTQMPLSLRRLGRENVAAKRFVALVLPASGLCKTLLSGGIRFYFGHISTK
jgi:hypothetical protein